MPLKKRGQKNPKNDVAAAPEFTNTTGRRSSTPLIVSSNLKNNKKPTLAKSVASVINSSVPIVARMNDDFALEPPGCFKGSRLKVANILGEGEFGSVYKGTYQLDDCTVVSISQ